MKKRYRILDWYVHQGNQAELHKCDHNFFLIGADGSKPDWNKDHRPLRENVTLITEEEALRKQFDIVLIRTPIPSKRYKRFIANGAAPIANIQTIDPMWLPNNIKYIVWNSREAMKRKKFFYKNRKEIFIPHGYDPKEFKPIDLEKNNRVLTIANHFKKRGKIMGFDIWSYVKGVIPVCDVVGSKNEDIASSLPHTSTFQELIEYYSEYPVYFNPTRRSAMPRTRAEAAMCGMPIVSTAFYDFKNYFRPGKDAILTNNKKEMVKQIKRLLKSKQMRIDFGMAARERAIKYFHIKDFIRNWNSVFDRAYKE